MRSLWGEAHPRNCLGCKTVIIVLGCKAEKSHINLRSAI